MENNNKNNKNRPAKSERTYTCEELCGRLTPCGNTHCKNYRRVSSKPKQ